MSLDAFTTVRPGITNQTANPNGSIQGNVVEEIHSMIENTLYNSFVLKDYFDLKSLSRTNQLVKYSSGRSAIKKLVPGVTPDGDVADFGKNLLTVDVTGLARQIIPHYDSLITSFDARKELSTEQGLEVKRYFDRAFLIQAAKAALSTTSPYGSVGHQGASQQVLATAGAAQDPALLTSAIKQLYAKMAEKEVAVEDQGTILVVRPSVWATLTDSDQIINGEYITAEGNRLQNTPMLKYLGVPVVRSNMLPNGVISGTGPGADIVAKVAGVDYEGDFSRLVALAFNPKRALMAAELEAPNTKIFYDNLSLSWYVDTKFIFNVKPNRTEFAGAVLLPE